MSQADLSSIHFTSSLDDLAEQHLSGFFAGWANAPTAATHLRILRGSSHVELAIDDATGNVVGFIHAISDGFFAASIPLLEVLPSHRNLGIGRELARRLLARLEHFYSVDLACDPPLRAFYARLGLRPSSGMMLRNYARQSTGAFDMIDDDI